MCNGDRDPRVPAGARNRNQLQDARAGARWGWERRWGWELGWDVNGRVEARTDTDTDTGTREAGGEEELAGNVGHVDEGKDFQGLHGPWRAGSARAGLGLQIDVCGVSMQVP